MFIKDTKDFTSCTITSVNPKGIATVETAQFKKALFPVSTIILYEYLGDVYYPITMEFRLIDNNILFMIKELSINSMDVIFNILESSMEKEEHWSNVFETTVIHLAKMPKFMYKLPKNFDVGEAQHIYELPKHITKR